ncbi:MAG TPA: SDR family NAD(P)-dependent oxidoreductase [Microthrixaceae bacterium]|nr:SDR family NAD(P)-dependent oxidoreductase [Microthrixaceae bacterium]
MKSAIVTGAGRGIGREEALLLAAEGAVVWVNDIDDDEARSVVEEIRVRGGSAHPDTHDVATFAGAEALVSTVVAEHGRLDVVVNNAGVLADAMSFSMDERQWDSVIGVHLRGHFAMTHFAGMHWRERSKAAGTDDPPVTGRIVNTTSESGLYGLAGQVNYAAAKAGIAAMTVVTARELHRYGVTVNAIAPRARTRMTESVLGSLLPEEGEFDEWDPGNIAPVVAWLASDAAAAISGQVFVVNGDKVHLMDGWTRYGRIDNAGRRWTVDELVRRAPDLFGERGSKLPPMGFGE